LTIKAQNPNPHQRETGELPDDDLEGVTGGTSVKSCSTGTQANDRPTEEVAFYYNKIAFNY